MVLNYLYDTHMNYACYKFIPACESKISNKFKLESELMGQSSIRIYSEVNF